MLPSIPGPGGEPPLIEEVKELDRRSVMVHSLGGVLNLAASGATVGFLVRHRDTWRRNPAAAIAGFAAGTYAADLISGTLHWTFDTWFDESVEPLKRMVYIVREHHLRPARIFRYRLRDEAGLLSWFGLAAAAPFYAYAVRAEETGPRQYAAAVTGVTLATEIALMLEFHKWGHRMRRGRAPRILQKAQLLLSPEVHLEHHSGRHDSNYCLINGSADRTLGRLGFFRGLEWIVEKTTGAVPRSDDVEWARVYGRPR